MTLLDNKGGILVDGTSIEHNSGTVLLSLDELQGGHGYTVRYDLYDKEIVTSEDDVEDSMGSASGITCKLPFVTQELLIIDKKLAA